MAFKKKSKEEAIKEYNEEIGIQKKDAWVNFSEGVDQAKKSIEDLKESHKVQENTLNLEDKIFKITKNIDIKNLEIEAQKSLYKYNPSQGEQIVQDYYKELLKEVSEWQDIMSNKEFTEEMFIQYQNYIGYNPELLTEFIKNHKVSENFMEMFFQAKKWGIHPAYILKHQSHLVDFIKKYKEYFNPEDYRKFLEKLEVDAVDD